MSASSSNYKPCMDGISLVKVQERTYRIPSASLLASRSTVERPPVPSYDTDSIDTTTTIYTEEIVTHYHSVHRTYHGLLIGKGGSTLKRLKLETGTRIDIMNGKDSVMVKGTQDKVDQAIKVIDAFIQQAFERAKPTHFLSLPTLSTYTTRKLEDFYKAISASTFHSRGLDKDMLIPSGKLHITLGVFKLLSPSDVENTLQFLKDEIVNVVRDFMDQEKVLSVRLRRLAIMQDNPQKTQVLYIQVQDETKNKILDKLCDTIRNKMLDAGYMQKENRPLKIHVTLIKTKPKKSEDGQEEERPTFDAQPILKSHGDLDLGVVHLDKLHLMKMSTTIIDEYISEGSIPVE
ncbi:AKAP7 2'5' RNA ligase-like domain-containing protein [Halteromyces radiatus]|uniref:AKAP7 2'5' RNA ligase-like domain-containing protein n=1 Tax=Halteromyces radiatus TaxID=101107 RepID=UPI0022210FDC|nr:AKAP7 2'5' RNA ligase-like domain-containing protein [Halteromyces radiatus]KAI8086115.1 AKAP7 2'5' RNA ligase-like domain-containing protein [Halteromyces radiatus]